MKKHSPDHVGEMKSSVDVKSEKSEPGSVDHLTAKNNLMKQRADLMMSMMMMNNGANNNSEFYSHAQFPTAAGFFNPHKNKYLAHNLPPAASQQSLHQSNIYQQHQQYQQHLLGQYQHKLSQHHHQQQQQQQQHGFAHGAPGFNPMKLNGMPGNHSLMANNFNMNSQQFIDKKPNVVGDMGLNDMMMSKLILTVLFLKWKKKKTRRIQQRNNY